MINPVKELKYCRYKMVLKKVNDFHLHLKNCFLPIDPIWIIKHELHGKVRTYQHAVEVSDMTMEELTASLGSTDASMNYSPDYGFPLLLYNNEITTPQRIRWSQSHEIGHYCLNHFTDFPQTRIQKDSDKDASPSLLKVLDKEADLFAINLLVPPGLLYFIANIYHLEKSSLFYYVLAHQMCGISKEASYNFASNSIEHSKKEIAISCAKNWLVIKKYLPFVNKYYLLNLPDISAAAAWTRPYQEEFERIQYFRKNPHPHLKERIPFWVAHEYGINSKL